MIITIIYIKFSTYDIFSILTLLKYLRDKIPTLTKNSEIPDQN